MQPTERLCVVRTKHLSAYPEQRDVHVPGPHSPVAPCRQNGQQAPTGSLVTFDTLSHPLGCLCRLFGIRAAF